MKALQFYFGDGKNDNPERVSTECFPLSIERENYVRSLTDYWLWGLTIGPGKRSELCGYPRQVEELSNAILTSTTHRHWRSLVLDIHTPYSPLLTALMSITASSLSVLTVLIHETSRLPLTLFHRLEMKNRLWYNYLHNDLEKID
tara:strand:- start:538 stop:972 length:435 start_codon:yes stop_codon:yes gene_type:complete